MAEYIYVLLIMILAGTIQGACGFGAGLLGMSILPFIFDYKTALPIMYTGAIFICLQLVIATYRSINWKILALPTLFSFLGRVMGLLVFNSFENDILNIILGILIFLVALYQLFFGHKIHIRANAANGSLVGIISGIMGGLASSSGPPLVLYYMNADLEKTEYIATIQMTFLAGTIFSISLLASTGGYTAEILPYGGVAVAGVLLGTMIGFRIFHRINREMLRKIVSLVLLAMGLSLIIKSVV